MQPHVLGVDALMTTRAKDLEHASTLPGQIPSVKFPLLVGAAFLHVENIGGNYLLV